MLSQCRHSAKACLRDKWTQLTHDQLLSAGLSLLLYILSTRSGTPERFLRLLAVPPAAALPSLFITLLCLLVPHTAGHRGYSNWPQLTPSIWYTEMGHLRRRDRACGLARGKSFSCEDRKGINALMELSSLGRSLGSSMS